MQLFRRQHVVLCRSCVRCASSQYTKTVNLPLTDFPLRSDPRTRECEIQHLAEFNDLYRWQQNNQRLTKRFCLHDGPPYANGDLHVGHALNKILKDITIRYKLMTGHKIDYKPGWDCHGLPIEMKALSADDAWRTMPATDIRKLARDFARRTVEKQKTGFIRWGIMADWDRCYHTFDNEYEAKQLLCFYQMYERDLIFQNMKPVFWSPSSRTALGEAELEYVDEHVSQSVYVRLPVSSRSLPSDLQASLENMRSDSNPGIFLLTWTTLAWTITGNEAVAYQTEATYSLCEDVHANTGDVYIMATDKISDVANATGLALNPTYTFNGERLKGVEYFHPLAKDKTCPMLPSHHVTLDKGTGLVHIAPAHGMDDFNLSVKHSLPLQCNVNEDGQFTDNVVDGLSGMEVQSEGNEAVIRMLRKKQLILASMKYTHSYPYDWRTKKPVIVRASKQWFIDTDKIKNQTLACLKDVKTYPENSMKSLRTMLESRPYWCISRQRVWGVPIPVFYNRHTLEPLINDDTIRHIVNLFEKHGSDCWWSLSTRDLLPPDTPRDQIDQLVKGDDILDIWFDSGVSWASVFPSSDHVADMYLEGRDQFRGWFQSSLLTSVALRDGPPYKALFVHGFVLDEQQRKMSKSAGNVIEPASIVNGGSDLNTDPAYGADALRLWVAMSNYHDDIQIGKRILTEVKSIMFKFRKTLRYILGSLHDFSNVKDAISFDNLTPLDQFMLSKLDNYAVDVSQAYNDMQYNRVVGHAIAFVNSDLSRFYMETIKDRSYCSPADSVLRRSCQTVQYHILDILSRSLAPILPHLAEEIHHYWPGAGSVFKTGWIDGKRSWINIEAIRACETAFQMRDFVYSHIHVPHRKQLDVYLCTESEYVYNLWSYLQPEQSSFTSNLSEIMSCSNTHISREPYETTSASSYEGEVTEIHKSSPPTTHRYQIIIKNASSYNCDRCRRAVSLTSGALCSRCQSSLNSSRDGM